MKQKKISITDLIKDYFESHPREDLQHDPVVDYVEAQYFEIYGRKPRDPWRCIRSLHEKGFLIKVRKGVYRYDPDAVTERPLEDFTPVQKKVIFERDGYKCTICGRGEKDGVELHIDHIKPRKLGGQATIENGQTLCAQHNFIKKSLNQTETGKKMFIRWYELAKKEDNRELANFCFDVLKAYETHGINSHINWDE